MMGSSFKDSHQVMCVADGEQNYSTKGVLKVQFCLREPLLISDTQIYYQCIREVNTGTIWVKTLSEEINFLKKIFITFSFIKSLLLGQILASSPSSLTFKNPWIPHIPQSWGLNKINISA